MTELSKPFGVERRGAERIPLRCPVEAGPPGERPVRGVTKNLSSTGAMLLLPSRFPLGTEIRVRIELPDDGEPVQLDGMVVWQDEGSRAPHPTGVHFLLPSPPAVARIRDLIYT
jgi:hypothetical protein